MTRSITPDNEAAVRKAAAPASRNSGLSIVVPCFNEAAGLARLHDTLAGVARKLKDTRGLRCELLFVDGDGQHPPGLIDRLVSHWLDDGHDVIYTAKAHRENESATHRFGVKT